MFNKFQERGIYSMTTVKILKEKNKRSEDFIIMIDEVYVQEEDTQYQSGEYIGTYVEGKIYKGIVRLKHFISFVTKSLV